ncbi:hypothetical protein CASFOL_038087 [Castilleja foliolosa]|uniref:Uncharacterized protein n=1 Tax=Castilleja foliolosa TaxID=1961234 RepID=A0ABD3BK03_9LAMI
MISPTKTHNTRGQNAEISGHISLTNTMFSCIQIYGMVAAKRGKTRLLKDVVFRQWHSAQ